MPKHKFVVTLNGEVFTRSTDRMYTHAVICKDHYPMRYVASKSPQRNWRRANPGHFERVPGDLEITGAWATFCGSKDLAEKAAQSERNKGWVKVTVVQVVQVK